MKKQYVLCVSNAGYPVSLAPRKVYERLPDPDGEQFGMFRVIGEDGEDYLYEQDRFVPSEVLAEAQALFAAVQA